MNRIRKHLVFTLSALGCMAWSATAANLEFDNGQSTPINGVSTNGDTLYVGRYTAGNQVTILNGGTVTAENGHIGQISDDNTLLVTGTGSTLQLDESLSIGETGNNNALTLADGGALNIGHSNGVAGAINIGNASGTAQLFAANGAAVNAEALYLGTSNNVNGSLTLTGQDTAMRISGMAIIGNDSSDNTLSVLNNATLVVTNELRVGSAGTTDNELNISGNVVVVDTADVIDPANNGININNGGQLTFLGDADLQNAADDGFNFAFGSTLEVGGTLQYGEIDSGMTVLLNGSLITNQTTQWDTGSEELYVGNAQGNNTLTIQDGATVIAGGSTAHIGEDSNDNTINVSGTNAQLNVTGQLIAGIKGDRNDLHISNTGRAIIGSDLRVGLISSSTGNEISISDQGSRLDLIGNAYIGEAGHDNSLNLTDGLLDIGQSLYIGRQGNNNAVNLTGTNAMATIGTDLVLGNIFTNAESTVSNVVYTYSGNQLSVENLALLEIGNNFDVLGNASMFVDNARITVGGNYTLGPDAEVFMRIGTNNLSTIQVTGTASLASNSTFRLFNDGSISRTTGVEQVILTSSSLEVDGAAADANLLTNNVNFIPNDLFNFDIAVLTNSIIVEAGYLSIADSAGLEGTSLGALVNDIDNLSENGNQLADSFRALLAPLSEESRLAVIQNQYGEKQASVPAHSTISMGLQSVIQKLTVRADNTRARSNATPQPNGAQGPHMPDQPMQGWLAAYSTKGSQDGSNGFSGYDSNIKGYMLGTDFTVAENVLMGLAGGSGRSDISSDTGTDTDTQTAFGSLYTSINKGEWFIDSSITLASSSIKSTVNLPLDTQADYNAKNFAFYLGGGKEYTGQYFILTPQVSLLANYYKQDAYSETSTTAVPRDVDSFDTVYVQSSIGCDLSFYTSLEETTLKPEFRLHWLHEFSADEENVPFSIGGTGGYNMILQAPEEDIIKIGTGLCAKMSEYLELRADLDLRRSSSYSDHTLLGSLRYTF